MKKLLSIFASASAVTVMALGGAMSAFAEDSAQSATAASSQQMTPAGSMASMIIPMVILFVLLYFVTIRPQKKRDQELKDMQANIQVGDEIVTGGGIVGIVVSIGDDTVVIETGGAKHKLRIKNWAITENVSAAERAKASKPAKKSPLETAGVETAGVVDESEKPSKKKKSE